MAGVLPHLSTESSRPFRDTGAGDAGRRLQGGLGEGGVLRKAVASRSTSSPSPCLGALLWEQAKSWWQGCSRKRLAGRQERVNPRGGAPPHHPFLPWWCLLQAESGRLRRALAGPRVSCRKRPARFSP